MYIVEVSEGTNIGNWDRDLSCNILAWNVSAFFPCLKNLSKTKLKGNKSIFVVVVVVGDLGCFSLFVCPWFLLPHVPSLMP